MTTKPNTSTDYTPIPTGPTQPPTYVILQSYPRPHRRHYRCRQYLRHILTGTLIILLLLSIYILWPSDPDLQVVRVKLNDLRVKSSSLDISLDLTVRVYNRDLFSLDYDSLTVAIGYRGRELGFVESEKGKIKAKRSSYVDAKLVVDGFEVLHDLIYFIKDVAKGSVPFDTVSIVKGRLGVFAFKIPIQAKVSCEVSVSPINQTVIRQNCYAE